MTSWQEKKRLELLEKRRKEHEQYAAERLAKISTIIAETLVNRATIDRIKNGTYGVKQPKKPPKAAEPAGVTTPEVSKPHTDGVMRVLISRAVETLRDTQGNTPDDCALVGKALGLLEAVEMMINET